MAAPRGECAGLPVKDAGEARPVYVGPCTAVSDGRVAVVVSEQRRSSTRCRPRRLAAARGDPGHHPPALIGQHPQVRCPGDSPRGPRRTRHHRYGGSQWSASPPTMAPAHISSAVSAKARPRSKQSVHQALRRARSLRVNTANGHRLIVGASVLFAWTSCRWTNTSGITAARRITFRERGQWCRTATSTSRR